MKKIKVGDVYKNEGCSCFVISHISVEFENNKITYDIIFFNGKVFDNVEECIINCCDFIKHFDNWKDFLLNNEEN